MIRRATAEVHNLENINPRELMDKINKYFLHRRKNANNIAFSIIPIGFVCYVK